MPGFLQSLHFSLAGEDPDNAFLGSNKILDSVACGTPVFCVRSPVREEYLGADYLGLFDDWKTAVELSQKLLCDKGFYREISVQTSELQAPLSLDSRKREYGDPFQRAPSPSH